MSNAQEHVRRCNQPNGLWKCSQMCSCIRHQQSLINKANFGGDVLMNRRAWRCKDRKTTISEMGSKPKTNGGSLNYHQGRRSQRDVEVCLGALTRSGVRWSTHSRNIMEGGAIIFNLPHHQLQGGAHAHLAVARRCVENRSIPRPCGQGCRELFFSTAKCAVCAVCFPSNLTSSDIS